MEAPVLGLPNFEQTFIIETDASKDGIGAVLMQSDHPLAFISRSLGPKWQGLSGIKRIVACGVCYAKVGTIPYE